MYSYWIFAILPLQSLIKILWQKWDPLEFLVAQLKVSRYSGFFDYNKMYFFTHCTLYIFKFGFLLKSFNSRLWMCWCLFCSVWTYCKRGWKVRVIALVFTKEFPSFLSEMWFIILIQLFSILVACDHFHHDLCLNVGE